VVNLLRFWRVFDVDRLIDMLRREAPLDMTALSESSTTVLVPITDAETGESRYVSPLDADPYELLHAAKAIPLLYRRRVQFFGRRYIDGEVGPTLNDHVREAESRGATRILVMNNGWPDDVFRHALKHLVARMEPNGLRERMERDFDTDGYVCVTSANGARITCIFPRDIPARFIEWRADRLCAAFDAGMQCARDHEADIRETFSQG
jgi:predicted patatin/cPLA2 family phospholipase